VIQLKYVKENSYYQRLLDRKFGGKVVPVDRFFNGKATIKHYCVVCGNTFWNKPAYLINLGINNHYCDKGNQGIRRLSYNNKKSNSKVSDEMKRTMLKLSNDGISNYEIARKLEITRATVRYHLKKLRQS
jgi:hypothetical protein